MQDGYVIVCYREYGDSGGMGTLLPAKLFNQYILPAIESDEAIAVDGAAQSELVVRSGPPELSIEPQAVPNLPPIALEVSGETYLLEENRIWSFLIHQSPSGR